MTRNLQTALLFLIVLVIAVFLYRQAYTTSAVRDSKEYFHLSKNLIHDNIHYSGSLSEEKDYRLYSKRTLGQPVYLALQFWSKSLIYCSQGLLLVLMFFLGLSMVRRLSDSKVVFSIFSIAFLFQTSALLSVGLLLSDLLLCAVVNLAYWVYTSKKSPSNAMTFGGLWALALLIKPVILPSLALIPLVLYLCKKETNKWAYGVILPICIWAMVAFLSYQNTSQFEYSSISTINISQYNAKLTVSKSYGYDSAQVFSENLMDNIPANKNEYNDYKASSISLSKQVILENICSYASIHAIGMVKMILDPGRFELFTFFNVPTSEKSLTEFIYSGKLKMVKKVLQKQPILYIVFLFLFAVQILKLLGFVCSFKKIRSQWIGFGIIAYFLIITGPVGAARFFIPASILFTVYVAVGWGELLNFLQKSPKS